MSLQKVRFALFVMLCPLPSIVGFALVQADQCYEPASSTEYCTDSNTHCNATTEADCNYLADYERVQFPLGPVESESGATKEAEEDCYRVASCQWSPMDKTCDAGPYGSWQLGDMTIVNSEVDCPKGP